MVHDLPRGPPTVPIARIDFLGRQALHQEAEIVGEVGDLGNVDLPVLRGEARPRLKGADGEALRVVSRGGGRWRILPALRGKVGMAARSPCERSGEPRVTPTLRSSEAVRAPSIGA